MQIGVGVVCVCEGERPRILAPVQTEVDATRLSLISNPACPSLTQVEGSGEAELHVESERPDWLSQALPMLFKAATHLQG